MYKWPGFLFGNPGCIFWMEFCDIIPIKEIQDWILNISYLCLYDRGRIFSYEKFKEICIQTIAVCNALRNSIQSGDGKQNLLSDSSKCAVEFSDGNRSDPLE